jgi:hypothetical protein
MKYALKNPIHKIIAFVLVVVITLGVLHIEQLVSFAYTAQTGMIYSSNKTALV